MPYSTTWEDKGIYWKFWGGVDISEVSEAKDIFYSDARSDNIRYKIFDALDVDKATATISEIRLLAARDKGASRSIPDVQLAIVVNKTEYIALAHVYTQVSELLKTPWEVKIFKTVEEARDWIGPMARKCDIVMD